MSATFICNRNHGLGGTETLTSYGDKNVGTNQLQVLDPGHHFLAWSVGMLLLQSGGIGAKNLLKLLGSIIIAVRTEGHATIEGDAQGNADSQAPGIHEIVSGMWLIAVSETVYI